MQSENLKAGIYVTATPIGDSKDITLRALEILARADAVICEEYKPGAALLKKLGIQPKELIALNEHNEEQVTPALIQRLLKGQSMALISDGGTPVFFDPGWQLVRSAVDYGIRVIPLPGASSLMAALSVLDFKLRQFHFAGFLSPKKEQRKHELDRLKPLRIPIVLMDTPYRLSSLLEETRSVFGGNRSVTLACDISMPSESILRGTISEVQKIIGSRKAEFILIIHAINE
jgi:16S rRNA (cytidine1402-2'-O)-methyltransferase